MRIADQRSTKINDMHLQKIAYVYLRQSSIGQVRNHRESTERQYALQELARNLGWPMTRIVVLDGDLGKSGTSATDREDFKTLVADVSLGKAGAVLAIEASRLARSNADWHRLIEICGITGTLIIDEDGCYDPCDFNDGLLLGLKGTMAQAELHFIRARLQGNKLNKARKGELRFPLPVGYMFDELNRIVKDADAQVRSSIELVFDYFQQCGSAYGVVQRFAREKLDFPKRSYGGTWAGKLHWGRLTDARVTAILKNPSYAGVYAFGRYRSIKEILENGEVRSRINYIPEENWLVNLQDHHEGYVTFEQYKSNLEQLSRNQTSTKEMVLSGPAREGLALLQGLLICGCCGRRMIPRYQGNGGIYPTYQCNWRKREGLSTKACLSVQCPQLDRAIEQRVLDVLSSEQMQLAIDAFEIVCRRHAQIDGQWKMRLQRAEYEAELAQRLSPLLANILLDDFDKELERRGLRFVRYADDFLVFTKTEKAALRVFASVERYLTRKLKLVVNHAKSCVRNTDGLEFLGYQFTGYGGQMRVSPKNLDKFRQRVRELTRRSCGISMTTRLKALGYDLRGWTGYFCLVPIKSFFVVLDKWVRRRIRSCY